MIDDGRRREVWENNHREEMSHKEQPGNSIETCRTSWDSGRRRGFGMSHRESRVWPRTPWTPMDAGLEQARIEHQAHHKPTGSQ